MEGRGYNESCEDGETPFSTQGGLSIDNISLLKDSTDAKKSTSNDGESSITQMSIERAKDDAELEEAAFTEGAKSR